MSGVNGTFRFVWTDYSGPVDITIYDKLAGTVDYNCKIFDMVQDI
jgi:hypothetical protein